MHHNKTIPNSTCRSYDIHSITLVFSLVTRTVASSQNYTRRWTMVCTTVSTIYQSCTSKESDQKGRKKMKQNKEEESKI